ncbi:MAG: tetratricopeptide repeat protein [Nevskiales bacterium]
MGRIGVCVCALSVALFLAPPALAAQRDDTARAAASTRQMDGTLAQARALLDRKQAQQAYDLLRPHEANWSGNQDFNYLYGVAALDSGHPAEAVFSLQRVVAADPSYPAARMELARAYYETGDYAAAREEFALLERSNPPPFARRVIGNYLSAINRRTLGSRPGLNYFFELGGGYDTNANGSTEDDQFLGFTLDEQNVEQGSAFAQVNYGLRFNFPLSDRTTGLVGGGGSHRWNFSADFVNSDRTHAEAGLVWRDGPVELFTNLGIYATYLDSNFIGSGDFNHKGAALDFGASRALSNRVRLGGELRAGAVRYDDNLEIRDVDQFIAVGNFEYQENLVYQPRFGLAIILGKDEERASNSPYGRDLNGLRATYSWIYNPRVRWYLQGGFLRSDFEGPFFGRSRTDDQFVAGLSAQLNNFIDPKWSWGPYALFVSNDSDIKLFEYDRFELGVLFRWASR